ncbi:MAG: lipoyl(octanoyl) transferase LipB [Bacteroidetes bacterium]|nr:lipoyl(octanoyl) transferase LipB [Bacteroidota bacterium]
MKQHPTNVINFGKSNYGEMWEIQKQLFSARLKNEISDTIIFTEHENVFTFGKASDKNHLLANEAELKNKSIEVFEIDRGGDVTFHGPGQVVCYPILYLSNYKEDVHFYLRNLEEVIIKTLENLKIFSNRIPDLTGVWIENEKIAAIGIKVSRWITMHGFAFNNFTDLSNFDRIIPCGIFHKGVTSLNQLGIQISNSELINLFCKNFSEVFEMNISFINKNELFKNSFYESEYIKN